ncbi:hypothetical protein J3U21_08590 [Gilliamella sp. B2776]|uniref:cold-shock protein n=1 Tax=unclassified Gilliamella TaxID=2685620 RepID=UPI002269816F|nr:MULTISPECIES: hypothetical protein [unclassified Gilliamella]MCX8649489.1 hypothetical protein [Gilliamella sp. B2779]MCX8654533.1 hypothetical protein [Gilliamella sp. B2737]MCX8656405.1 hypothetical protein [Gilliamella sp. B2894]MCX8664923.1 hypothetical protein [Gilliamella sp. B2887]MCX8692208.1 hypothetical protein [Gilliamella sp. B2776]
MISQIKNLYPDKNNEDSYYGFIRALDEKNDYYFTKKDLSNLNIDELKIGSRVTFTANEKDSGIRFATNIKLLNNQETKNNEQNLSDDNSLENNIDAKSYKTRLIDSVLQIKSITDPIAFEDSVFDLLKLIGLNKIFQFDRDCQAGKADGFFIIDNLAVMYDCTLKSDFESYKEEQIENYINKLNQKSQLTFNIKKIDGGITPKTMVLTGKNKQVWIVTKGESKEINDYDNVKVKEISIHDLCEIFKKRLSDMTYDNEKLVNDFIFIGK